MAQTKNNHSLKTALVKKEEKKLDWYILDAEGKTLGRFASEVTKILRGKHRPDFTSHVNCGDGVIIINAGKIAVTGNKEATKIYRHYTGYVGGLREVPFRVMKARKPTFMLERAIKGMMPKTRLARAQLKRLRIFAGTEHGLDAQKPIKTNI